MRDVLITVDEVLFHAQTKQAVDPRTIEQSIIVAEEGWIREALTDKLYFDFISKKNTEVTVDNKADLETKINAAFPTNTPPVTLNVGDIVNAFEFLSDTYVKLWKQYLWKLTAECVMMLALPEGYVQFATEGTVLSAPLPNPLAAGGTAMAPPLQSVKWAMDKKVMNRIDPMIQAMHSWICVNKIDYPLYGKHCECDDDSTPYKRKSAFILDAYDDEPKNCGCED